MIETALPALGVALLAGPLALVVYFGLRLLTARPASESHVGAAVLWTVGGELLVALAAGACMLAGGVGESDVDLGSWVAIPELHYHIGVKLQLDALSLTFVFLTLILCGAIARFALRYLHREPGFHRFFFLYAVFVFGMTLASTAGTIETLFVGWELVGLSSVFLVAFFHERAMPAHNGVRIWSVYRIADAALLGAAILLHRLQGDGDFAAICGRGVWPGGESAITGWPAFAVGFLIFIAAAGKSALVPFSGWLPRAMEGPTPSSAIFYGALSVHLGAFLLLRVGPLLDQSPLLCVLIVIVGLATAAIAALAGAVQADIKSSLTFASLVQVGIIVAEIGVGLRWIPLVHLVGHAFLRTLQFLRAPTLLHDYHELENAIGGRLHHRSGFLARLVGPEMGLRLYRFALERGGLDAAIDRFAVRPFLGLFVRLDRLERRITGLLAGRAAERPPKSGDSLEEVA